MKKFIAGLVLFCMALGVGYAQLTPPLNLFFSGINIGAFTIKDSTDPTKVATFSASGIQSGTSRNYNLANAAGTITVSTSAGAGGIPVFASSQAYSTGTGLTYTAAGGLVATGTTTNDSAAAGVNGEFKQAQLASGSAVSLTTATPANVTSQSLTAGDWDCWGVVDYVMTGATTSDFKSGINTTSATFGGQDTFQNMPLIGTALSDTFGHSVAPTRVSLSATTTVYLVAQATFSVGTETAYGTLNCRRMR